MTQKINLDNGVKIPRHVILGYASNNSKEKLPDVTSYLFCLAFLMFSTNKRHKCRFTLNELKTLSGLSGGDRVNLRSGRMGRIASVLQKFVEDGSLCIEKKSIYGYTLKEYIDAEWFYEVDSKIGYVYISLAEYEAIFANSDNVNALYDLFVYLYIKSRIWGKRSPSDLTPEAAYLSQAQIAAAANQRKSTISESINRLINDCGLIATKAMSVRVTHDSNGEVQKPYKPKTVYVLRTGNWREELRSGVNAYNEYLDEHIAQKYQEEKEN